MKPSAVCEYRWSAHILDDGVEGVDHDVKSSGMSDFAIGKLIQGDGQR